MSGPIGVMSTKFVLAAGALLLSARVEMREVPAILDPSSPTSAVTPAFARLVGVDDTGDGDHLLLKRRVVGIDHAELRLRQVEVAGADRGGDLTVGADLLRQIALVLDFRKNRLRVIDSGSYRQMTARLVAIPTSITPDGCLGIVGTEPGGAPIRAAIDGYPAIKDAGSAQPISFGRVTLGGWARGASRGRCTSSKLILDWRSFAGRMVVLDLGKNQIWLSANT